MELIVGESWRMHVFSELRNYVCKSLAKLCYLCNLVQPSKAINVTRNWHIELQSSTIQHNSDVSSCVQSKINAQTDVGLQYFSVFPGVELHVEYSFIFPWNRSESSSTRSVRQVQDRRFAVSSAGASVLLFHDGTRGCWARWVCSQLHGGTWDQTHRRGHARIPAWWV